MVPIYTFLRIYNIHFMFLNTYEHNYNDTFYDLLFNCAHIFYVNTKANTDIKIMGLSYRKR